MTATITTTPEAESDGTQMSVLLRLASDAELFHTDDEQAFASVQVGKHRENHPVNSRFFSDWLVQRFRKLRGTPPQPNALRTALDAIAGRARFEGSKERVWTRIAERDGAVYLDLANDDWQAIKITASGWQIVNAPPVRFRRPKGMMPLPLPAQGGNIEELRPFLNLEGDDAFVLFVGFLMGALRPRGPYPLLEVTGEQGTAKSTQCRVARRLIDPSRTLLRSNPKDERDLIIAANNAWLPTFDNLSILREPLSDAFCRLTTGGGFGTRKLYADDEEVIFDVTRPVVINGIEELATRGDLLDRALIVKAAMIPDDARRDEEEFWETFDAARRSILGALLNGVSTALRRWPTTRLKRKPRLADFAKWVTAAEEAFGWPEHTFLNAYSRNRAQAAGRALDADYTAAALLALVRDQDWSGTASELLDDLRYAAGPEAMRLLPGAPHALRGKLDRLAPSLRKSGVGLAFRAVGKESRKMIYITRRDRSAGSAGSAGAERTPPTSGTVSADGAIEVDAVVPSNALPSPLVLR